MNAYKRLYNFVHGDRRRRYRSSALAVTDKPVSWVPISRKFIQKYIFGVGCAAVPLQVRLTGLGIPGPALRQQPPRPKTPAISNRNAIRCTSTV